MIPFPRFYLPLALLLGCVIPTVLPVSLWNECLSTSLFVAFACRFAITSNITFMTNSVSHTSFDALCWGSKPYDKWDLDIFSKNWQFIQTCVHYQGRLAPLKTVLSLRWLLVRAGTIIITSFHGTIKLPNSVTIPLTWQQTWSIALPVSVGYQTERA